MAKIFVTRKIPKVGIDLLKASGHQVRVWPKSAVIPRKELLKGAKGAEAVLSLLTDKIDDAFFDAAGRQLKIVANYAVGYDNFDLAAFKRRGVLAANTPGVLNGAVAEHAVALMFAVAKRIPESDRFTRAGKYKGWEPELLLGTELAGKTLGILGLGRIGAGVAKRAKGMDMDVLYYDVKRNEAFEKELGAKYATVEELLGSADVVSLHVPLLPSTRHLIDAKRLKTMKRTAILVNTSRGPVIDEKALVAALKARRIGGAGLDVYENEPKLAPGLAKLPNVVLTPHTASATVETRDAMARLAAQAVLDALAGKTPTNLVPLP
ncbi:MAG TPA: D-glycerate dehydrogenase [Patescibacteria group bacterium]|nr:D-glycerate dehydrogenase [Patescibacteria group bacterium]